MITAVLIAFAACTKDSNKDGDINQSPFSAEVVIGGDTIKMEQGLVGYTNGPGQGGGVIDTNDTYLFRQFTQFASPNDTLRIFFIDTFGSEPTAAQKEALVRTGSYPTGYGTADVIAPDASLKAGAAVVYIDSLGNRWTTDRNPENQPNWSFNISRHELNNVDNVSKYMTDITLSARLYNPMGGTPVDITVINMRARTIIP